jgi:hypothetical protein
LPQFIIPNHQITPSISQNPNTPSIIVHPPHPPTHIWNQIKTIPINSITNHKQYTTRDHLTITKKYHSYLCTWVHTSRTTFAKWVSQSYLYRHPQYNYPLLQQYYQTRQINHFIDLIRKQFNTPQNRDTRFINPSLHLPLVKISIAECNPKNDIQTTDHTIQVLHSSTYLYDQDGRHLHTIPLQRLEWLWTQYHHSTANLPTLEPPLQAFETEIIWLVQQYKRPKDVQYFLPINMLTHLLTTFNIKHTYFSSLLTCSTMIKHFYSPFPRDYIFGSLGTAFSHKWNGYGFAHPPPPHYSYPRGGGHSMYKP